MWIVFAFGSAFFAGITAVLAKCGIKKTDPAVATAVRTVIVLAFAWIAVFIAGSQTRIASIDGRSVLFLVLSGLSTGASWLCYFKALQTGEIDKVTAVDKSSTVLTVILAFALLHESINPAKAAGVALIAVGTLLMLEIHGTAPFKSGGKNWFFPAAASAVFASLTSILGKMGIKDVESNLGTAIRTGVVLVMAWLVVLVTGKAKTVKNIPKNELGFICLSGIATGGSWICYYKALQTGPASAVVPIDKLSILVTVAFSYIVFHEKLSKKSAAGLVCIVVGTLAMLIR